MEIPLPWERVLWSCHPVLLRPSRERYLLTNFRLVRIAGADEDEILLEDIGEIHRTESRLDRLIGGSTLAVRPRYPRRRPIVLRHVRHGHQLAALLDLLSEEPRATIDLDAIRATMTWEPAVGHVAMLKL